MTTPYCNPNRQAITWTSTQQTVHVMHQMLTHNPYFTHVVHHHIIYPADFSPIQFSPAYYF